MKHAIVWLGCLASLTVLVGCGLATDGSSGDSVQSSSAALGAETTSSTITAVSCESAAFLLSVDATFPSSVSPGEMFSFDLAFHLFPPGSAPFGGVFAGSATAHVDRATPSDPTLPFETFAFAQGERLPNFGAGTATVTASSTVGSPVEVHVTNFDYTLVPSDTTHNALDAHCTADAATALVATIPIVNEAASKDDCKGGGYRAYTDESGNAFKNQGQCETYVK
jgi:hypothetical protein